MIGIPEVSDGRAYEGGAGRRWLCLRRQVDLRRVRMMPIMPETCVTEHVAYDHYDVRTDCPPGAPARYPKSPRARLFVLAVRLLFLLLHFQWCKRLL